MFEVLGSYARIEASCELSNDWLRIGIAVACYSSYELVAGNFNTRLCAHV